MRNTFIASLIKQAEQDDRIFLLTPDLGFSVLEEFEEKFPDRFLNTGIAEQNAVGIAAGLALSGKIPYVYSITPFVTMRPFEQVRVDAAYMNTNVRLVGVGSGYAYGHLGPTHHSIEDIAVMRALPNMMVACPGDPVEVQHITELSFTHQGPMYIRLGKRGEPNINKPDAHLDIVNGHEIVAGDDFVLITTGNMLEEGRDLIAAMKAKRNLAGSLISMPIVKPLDVSLIQDLISRGVPMFTLEEHNIIGGLGSAVAEVIAESGQAVKFKRLGVNDVYTHQVGSQKFLRDKLVLKLEKFL